MTVVKYVHREKEEIYTTERTSGVSGKTNSTNHQEPGTQHREEAAGFH